MKYYSPVPRLRPYSAMLTCTVTVFCALEGRVMERGLVLVNYSIAHRIIYGIMVEPVATLTHTRIYTAIELLVK